jgi:hypothetical protein
MLTHAHTATTAPSPYIHVIVTLYSHPSCTLVGGQGIPALDAGRNLVHKKLPDVVPGLVGAETFARIPDVVRKLFVPEWVTYVPLTYLTDEYCENIAEHHKLEPTVHLDPTTGIWTRKGDSLPDRHEANLTFMQWTRAWQRLLGLLDGINHPERLRWLAHTQLVMNQPSITKHWPLWVRYCIAVRQRGIQQGLDVSVFQVHIFNSVKTTYERDRSDAASLAYINSEFARRSGQDLIRTKTQGPFQPTSSMGSSRTAHHPSTTLRSTQGASRCFICGSTDHTSVSCTATSSATGSRLLATRSTPSTPWSIGGKPFCYKFNSTRGCNFKSCSNTHICSLCGSPGHDAQACHH